MRRRILLGGILCVCCTAILSAETLTVGQQSFTVAPLHTEDFEGPANRWRFDGRGRAWVEDGRLQMDADGFESTAWFTEEMEGDLVIQYQAHILDPVNKNNINLFFMATATDRGDVLDVPFTGSYPEYHKLPNYIWTITGSHTRLRRNPGFQILSEDKEALPTPHKTHDLTLVIRNGEIRCYIDGRLIHSYDDPHPHHKGKLAFRTFRTRLWWDNLRIYRIVEAGKR